MHGKARGPGSVTAKALPRQKCVRTAVDVRSRDSQSPTSANRSSVEQCHGTCPKTLQQAQLSQSEGKEAIRGREEVK